MNGEVLELLDAWLTTSMLGQASALLLGLALTLLAARAANRWYLRREESDMRWRNLLTEAAIVASPYVLATLLFGTGALLLQAADRTHSIIDPAARIAAAMVLIRILFFAVRRSFSPDSRLRSYENRLALAVGALVAAQILGWLDLLVALLDSIGLSSGEGRITIWSVMSALFAVSICVILSLWAARWLDRRVSKLDALAPSTRIGIVKTSYAFFIGLGVLLGLRASGVDLTALTIFSGAIGLGLGFGLQAIAANFVSGFVLLADKSIKPGDVISFTGTTGTSTHGFGWVEELRGRYIVVRDRDGVATLVPNQNVITNQVINWSYGSPRVRLRIALRISYQDDVELALQLLLDAAAGHPRILTEPAPVSRLMDFTDYGMELEIRFWIADPAEGVNNVRSDVNRRIWSLFRQHGITIPPAQREIRILEGHRSASTLAPRPGEKVIDADDGED
ncbi:MAG: mechanosensitive ion channel family protein [Steroidobacteraceae bacterium]